MRSSGWEGGRALSDERSSRPIDWPRASAGPARAFACRRSDRGTANGHLSGRVFAWRDHLTTDDRGACRLPTIHTASFVGRQERVEAQDVIALPGAFGNPLAAVPDVPAGGDGVDEQIDCSVDSRTIVEKWVPGFSDH